MMIGLGLGLCLPLPVGGGGGGDPTPAPDGAMLMFVTGQSNSRVAGTSSATPPVRYTDGSLGEVYSFVDGTSEVDGTFEVYDVATNADPDNTGTAWGTEAEFIYQMRQSGDVRPVYVVKRSRNGQNLYDQWHPDTSGAQFDSLRAKNTRARQLLSDAAVTVGPEVIIWNQGEADANVGAGSAADDYASNFTAWFAAIRAEITDGLAIVQRIRPLGYDGIEGVTTAAGWPRAWTVREAQIAVPLADGNATAIDTDFVPANFGNIHPGEPWIEGMGQRSYAAYAGTYSATYGSITDTAPAPFDFVDAIDVATSQIVLSTAVLLTGYERRAPVSVTGGEFRTLNSLNGDSVVSDWGTSGVVDKFQKIQLRTTSGAGLSESVTVDVTIGGVSADWSVTTADSVVTYEPETDAFTSQVVTNGGVTITGPQKSALDDFYVTAKASTWWPKLSRIYLSLADAVSSGLDLVDQSSALSQAGALAANYWEWAPGTGWSGLGTSNGGLDMNFDPSANLAMQDNMAIGLFCSSFSSVSAPLMVSQGDRQNYLRPRSSSTFRGKVNQASNTTSDAVLGVSGWVAAVRGDAASLSLYHNSATAIDTEPDVSVTPTDTSLEIGDSAGTYGDGGVLGAFVGSALTGAELMDLATAVDALHAEFGN